MPVQPTLMIPVLALLWIAAAWDVHQRRIPNWLVLAAALVGVSLQSLLTGASGLLAALAGLVVGLLVLLPGYLLGGTGAGDVKLMAAIGTFLGPQGVLLAALASIAAGSVVALGYAASSLIQRDSISPWRRYGLMFRTFFTTFQPVYLAPAEGEVMGRKFPFAVSIALGTTLFLSWPWLQARLPA